MKRIKLTNNDLKQIIKDTLLKYKQETNRNICSGRLYGKVPDFTDYVNHIQFSKEFMGKQNDNVIQEGLIKTYDIQKVKKYITYKFDLSQEQFVIHTRTLQGVNIELCMVILDKTVDKTFVGQLKHDMNACGYFLCTTPKYDRDYLLLVFEPHFTTDITNTVMSNYEYLYHATPTLYVNKILKQGLIPKGKNSLFFYPDRIYCIASNNITQNEVNAMKNVQAQRASTNPYDNNEYTILKIDVGQLPKNIKFFVDPMSLDVNAVLTHDNIPPQAITILGTLKQ